jgi:DNA-directed RNA polymerase subunit F
VGGKMNIITEEVVTDAEAKKIIDGIKKELRYEQKNALDVLKKFVDANPEKLKKLVEELKSIEKLREKQIIAIANFLPEDKDDLRAILHKEYAMFTPEELDRILETVKKTVV